MSNVYVLISAPSHPNAKANGQIYEHTYVMSQLLGRPLTALEVVHHKDENRSNNAPENLQLFSNQAEHLAHHNLLRMRARALAEAGNETFMKCPFCKIYSAPSEMVVRKNKNRAYHKACNSAYSLSRRATPEGKAAHAASTAKSVAKKKLKSL